MKIIIYIDSDEAYRTVEDEDENIRPAFQEIIRKIEDACCKYQIRYHEIEVKET